MCGMLVKENCLLSTGAEIESAGTWLPFWNCEVSQERCLTWNVSMLDPIIVDPLQFLRCCFLAKSGERTMYGHPRKSSTDICRPSRQPTLWCCYRSGRT